MNIAAHVNFLNFISAKKVWPFAEKFEVYLR